MQQNHLVNMELKWTKELVPDQIPDEEWEQSLIAATVLPRLYLRCMLQRPSESESDSSSFSAICCLCLSGGEGRSDPSF